MSLRATHNITQSRGSVLVTGPASEPVAAAQLRSHLADDAMLDADANLLIQEARELIENRYNIAIVTQTWRVAFDRWPSAVPEWWDGVRDGSVSDLYRAGSAIELPRWPVQSVSSITVYDAADNATAVDASAYFNLDVYRTPARLVLKDGKALPVATRNTNAIVIDYVAGYATVTASLKKAVLMVAAYLYTNRGDCGSGGADAITASGAAALIGAYGTRKL